MGQGAVENQPLGLRLNNNLIHMWRKGDYCCRISVIQFRHENELPEIDKTLKDHLMPLTPTTWGEKKLTFKEKSWQVRREDARNSQVCRGVAFTASGIAFLLGISANQGGEWGGRSGRNQAKDRSEVDHDQLAGDPFALVEPVKKKKWIPEQSVRTEVLYQMKKQPTYSFKVQVLFSAAVSTPVNQNSSWTWINNCTDRRLVSYPKSVG